MIEVLKKIWRFAKTEQGNINRSVVLGFFYAVFHIFQIMAIYFVLTALLNGDTSLNVVWLTIGLLLISVAGRAVINRFAQLQQTHAGYFMVANQRIHIGNKLKSVPMGYFNDKSLGELTGVATTILGDLENTGPEVLVGILNGFINSVVFILFLLAFDFRLGLLVLAGTLLYIFITSRMEQRSASLAAKRQQSEAALVSAVLEQVQGMSVIKSFNLTGKGDRKVQNALEENRRTNLDIERLFTPYTIAQQLCLYLFSVLIMGASVYFCLNGSMSLTNALMGIILSFLAFAQIESAGSATSALRIVGNCIDQAEAVDEIPELDLNGHDIVPECHDIVFSDVDFSYDKRQILHKVSFEIKDKTTTAIVGPSGSGKTTLCHLIARFWDADGGFIAIGGHDVRDYTLEALMSQVSMVFQRVYLFADTIENNIRFGRPEATRGEVIAAAKKACCHEFIEALPEGYDTVIGEGGATLSGGEKQRISIARAILKDAPIIIFDEATANVDPENEDKLQKAMEALMQDKTIVMIAHRLKTVRNADQILVLDRGQIVQKGTHDTLMQQDGLYRRFVAGREESAGWKL